MSIMGSPYRHMSLFASPVSLLDIPLHLLIPEQFLGWVLCSRMFPEKTPEESDDAQDPQQNRPKSHIPGGK